MNLGTLGGRFFQSPLFSPGTENTDDRVKQAAERTVVQNADLRHEQSLIGREQFAGSRVADDAEGALFEVGSYEPNRLRIGVSTAGYLAHDPIAATDIGEHDGRSQLALGEVGKRERNECYRAD
jgi:hypothetical protein